MKNILIFLNTEEKFDEESEMLVKVQIDNSLELGWKKEDIILATNFNYEYNGIKSLIIDDKYFYKPFPMSNKITGVIGLFEMGIIKERELYWSHDFDAFQLEPIIESEIKIGESDIGLCDYNRVDKWAGGSVFFRKGSRDIFEEIKETMYKHKARSEPVMHMISKENEQFKKRIKKMNISYNFIPLNIRSRYKEAIKPLKVVHFHPFRGVRQIGVSNALEFFKGDNKMETCFLTDRIIKIFNKHGIK